MKYNLAIIGGGAAGLMAAIAARDKHPDWEIVLLEKNAILGRKILITGAGRCNLTNVNLGVRGEAHYNHPDFVKKVLTQFGYKEITKFFNDLGLQLVEEKKNNTGKIFPASDAASSVVDLLVDAVVSRQVEIKTETICKEIKKNKDQFELGLLADGKKVQIVADKVILAAGGKTYPALGADGSGFVLAEKFDHHLVEPIPSGVPLEGKNKLAQELQGLKMFAEVATAKGEKIVGDILFTKYGLSGMGVLLASRFLSSQLHLNKKSIQIEINFMPGFDEETAVSFWSKRKTHFPQRVVEVDWSGVFSNKFAKVFLKAVGLSGKKYQEITMADLKKAIKLLIAYPWVVTGTRGWNEAEFTAGGVDCQEIKADTLESKKIPGLYFAGEVVDIDGEIGGYNLSWAWASGFVAGQTV